MQAEVEQTLIVKLKLTKEEAEWLRGVMQNPLYANSVTDEYPHDRENREKLWNALGVVNKP